MATSGSEPKRNTKVRGTTILSTDNPQQYREKLARIAMDEMYQFVAVLDAQGTLLEVNRAALEGAGLKLSDVKGKPFWKCFWWGVSREIQETLEQAISRVSKGEFVRYDVEVYGRASGKETIVIDFSMIPVADEQGKIVFIVPEGRDITEKKAQEREIAQKNADLQALLERIRELDEIKTQFFANVSHELRTPLALIIGPAQRLMDENSTMAPHQRRESAGVIARNAQILLKHVNDLLDLSKLEAGKLKIELRDADVASLVRLMASHFDILAHERTIDYRVEAPASVLSAIDPEKLERILMNLLSNAFKFVPDSGRIQCALHVIDKDVVISVDDSGPGVKPELRHAIFERFRQGEGGANRQFGGTGLGLAIAKEFVEMHRGRLEVLDSNLGGARFVVTLPNHRLHPEQAISTERIVDDGLVRGIIEELRPGFVPRRASESTRLETVARATVLVVEDNLDMNRFIAQTLAENYEVLCAFNGQEGLEKAVAIRPTMIVSDIMMPVMNGAEMIAEIGKRSELADIPILILSAKADEELKIELLAGRAQDFVTKPFSEKDLLVRVRNLIEVRQSQERERRLYQAVLESEARAREADRRKDEFLAMLGHELRNPLAPIMTALQVMDLKDETSSSKERQLIDRQVRHLGRLVDDLLDIARVTRGKLRINKKRIDLALVIERAVEMASPLFEQRSHNLRLVVPRTGLVVDADASRLAQVVANLLTNAAKYTEPGGSIVLTALAEGDRIIVAVKDNGQGIAPDLLPQIFDLFVQGQRTLERAQGGLGIGLALVRNLVELHGGHVEAKSGGAGQGSEFVIELPAASDEGPPAPLSARVPAVDHSPSRSRVLVVDDNVDAAEVLAEALGLLGHDVVIAHDGPAALAAAKTFPATTALLDIGLPVMDGYELASLLRQVWADRPVQFVAITGYGQETDKEKSKVSGFDAHLVKPVDLNDLRVLFEPPRTVAT
jgi:PAS domain S-box-containing protein